MYYNKNIKIEMYSTDIISFIVFSSIKKVSYVDKIEEVTMSYSMGDNNYLIIVESDAYSNCTKNIQITINKLIDYSDIDKIIKNIKKYFIKNEVFCE